MVVLASQYGENTTVSSCFPADGLHAWGIFQVIPLEFQEIKQQPFLWHSLLFLVRPSSMKMRRAKGPKSDCPILYPIAQKALSPLTQKEIRD